MGRLFSDSIHGDGIFFKHARGTSDKSGKEFHIYHEIILFLDGDAEFITEDLRMRLQPFTLIVIPRETYHQMVIHGDQEAYYRCVLQFGDVPELSRLMGASLREVQAFQAEGEIRHLFDKLMTAAQTGDVHGALLLKAVLVLLLDELRTQKDMTDSGYHQNETIRRAVEYINRHLAQPLTIPEIAQACSISPSALSHIFQKELYISVHKFIVKKRLMQAYHRIRAGQAATVAAEECGFQDYSGFYKQYKKAFGFPPSQKRQT